MVSFGKKQRAKLMLGLLLFAFLFSSESRGAERKKGKELAAIAALNPIARDIIYGKKVNQISSCAVVDGISWKFRPDGRQSRVILRDNLRLNSEYEYSSWEISQVMDPDGFSTFVFRRQLKKNKTEAYAIKDYLYNKILETSSGAQVIESRDIRHLIGKPAFIFTTLDSATVTYFPGPFKNSYIVISSALGADGQSFAPVYLKSMICYRPDEALEALKIDPKDAQKNQDASKPSSAAPKK